MLQIYSTVIFNSKYIGPSPVFCITHNLCLYFFFAKRHFYDRKIMRSNENHVEEILLNVCRRSKSNQSLLYDVRVSIRPNAFINKDGQLIVKNDIRTLHKRLAKRGKIPRIQLKS